jgi:hypothetical protein
MTKEQWLASYVLACTGLTESWIGDRILTITEIHEPPDSAYCIGSGILSRSQLRYGSSTRMFSIQFSLWNSL